MARFAHVNLIAADWRKLARFYVDVFGCVALGPERKLAGDEIERATGIPGAGISGAHLRLPGCGEGGPTLEVFQYDPTGSDAHRRLNTPGLGHTAWAVEDVPAAGNLILAHGGRALGERVSLDVPGAGRVTFQYLADPEGNAIEIQRWER